MSSSENEKRAEPASPYVPVPALIERATRVTENERIFIVRPEGPPPAFDPGQFFMAGIPGYGEAPFSVASPPTEDGTIEFCIKAAGNVTEAIHRRVRGDTIWIRGPFGRGFDVAELYGRDLLMIAGGIGMVPMRGLLKAVLAEREKYGRITLIYGSKRAEDFLYVEESEEWKGAGVELILTVDTAQKGWGGNVGLVTTLMAGLSVDPAVTTAVVIGPPVMYRFAILRLWEKRIAHDRILLSLERRMKCGLGKCGHCQINSSYACQEGPVYKLSELKGAFEAFG